MQGLAFWSAFQLSGRTTLEAFVKKANGVTPSWSFNGAGTSRGLAWDYTGRHLQLALFGAMDGTVGAHAGWLGRHGQAGVTVTPKRVSLDGRAGIRGMDIFGEAAWNWKTFAGVAGSLFPMGEHWKGALQLRAIPSAYSAKKNGEYGAAAGVSFLSDARTFKSSLTVDAALLPKPATDTGRRQVASTGLLSWNAGERWLFESRLVYRYRNYEDDRADVRVDATWTREVWTIKGRLNGVHDGGFGLLGYLEGGWKPPGGTGWIRLRAGRAGELHRPGLLWDRLLGDGPGPMEAAHLEDELKALSPRLLPLAKRKARRGRAQGSTGGGPLAASHFQPLSFADLVAP